MSYNGWSNYETWRVYLEMVDGMSMEDFGVDSTETVYAKHLGEMIQDFCESIIEEQSTAGLALDLALYFLNKVDWTEIAEHLIEDRISA